MKAPLEVEQPERIKTASEMRRPKQGKRPPRRKPSNAESYLAAPCLT